MNKYYVDKNSLKNPNGEFIFIYEDLDSVALNKRAIKSAHQWISDNVNRGDDYANMLHQGTTYIISMVENSKGLDDKEKEIIVAQAEYHVNNILSNMMLDGKDNKKDFRDSLEEQLLEVVEALNHNQKLNLLLTREEDEHFINRIIEMNNQSRTNHEDILQYIRETDTVKLMRLDKDDFYTYSSTAQDAVNTKARWAKEQVEASKLIKRIKQEIKDTINIIREDNSTGGLNEIFVETRPNISPAECKILAQSIKDIDNFKLMNMDDVGVFLKTNDAVRYEDDECFHVIVKDPKHIKLVKENSNEIEGYQ